MRTIVPDFKLPDDGYKTLLQNTSDILALAGMSWTYANVWSFVTTLPDRDEIGTGSWTGKFSQVCFHRAHKKTNVMRHFHYFTIYLWEQTRDDLLMLEDVLRELVAKEEAGRR